MSRVDTVKASGVLLLVGALGLAGCGSADVADQSVAAAPSGWSQPQLSDFVALASDAASGAEIAVVSGSVVDGRGAGELTVLGGHGRATNVAFTVQPSQPVTIETETSRITLNLDDKGQVRGSGTVGDAEGVVTAVNVTGTANLRSDEAIPDSDKCGLLDEKMLVVGSPAGPLYEALAQRMRPEQLGGATTLPSLVDHWGDYDALVVDAASMPALQDSAALHLFFQGSKWVVITNADQGAQGLLSELMPIVSTKALQNSQAVAVRAGDPGGSWNQSFQTVPLHSTMTAKGKKLRPVTDQARLTQFVDQLHKQADNCAAVAPDQAQVNDQHSQNPANFDGSVRVQHAAMLSDGGNGPVVSNVAVPAYSDQATESASKPLSLPANSYGFSHSMYVEGEHTLPGSMNVKAHPHCNGSPKRYQTASSGFMFVTFEQMVRCPKEWRTQKATVGGTEDVLVLLTADSPASFSSRKQYDDSFKHPSAGPDTPHVNLRWTVLHQQSVVVNASTLKDVNGSHTLAYSGENGTATTRGSFSDDYALRERGWMLVRAHTDVKLGDRPSGTAKFVAKNDSSFPLKTITSSNESKSISGSWSLNAGGGTFAAVPIMNIGGGYSQSWSRDVSASVPSWSVRPSFENDSVNIAWDTNSTGDGKHASFADYRDDKVRTFGYNDLNVSGLNTNSVYAWQSGCMFGKVAMKINREMYFASVYSKFPLDQHSFGIPDLHDPDSKDRKEISIKNEVVKWSLPSEKYEIDFNDPSISIYPKSAEGFKGLTPDGRPVIYAIEGCAQYPVPDAIKDAVAKEEKRKQEEAAIKKAQQEAAAARQKQDDLYARREACKQLAGAARANCLRGLEGEDDE